MTMAGRSSTPARSNTVAPRTRPGLFPLWNGRALSVMEGGNTDLLFAQLAGRRLD